MIGYITLGTNDFDGAAQFYDAVLGEAGAKRIFETPRLIAWGTHASGPMVGVTIPHNEAPATVGNGVMIALHVKNKAEVDAVYAKAIALGGTDEGPPGPRGGSGFYAGYFRDLDGNKLNAYILG